MPAINFVKERRKKLTANQLFDLKLMNIAGVGLGVVFAVFLIFVGARWYFFRTAKALVDNQNAVKRSITQKEEIESQYNVFAQKLKTLSELFGQRKNKQEALAFFGEIFGPDIIVSGLDYSSAEDGIVSFTIRAPSVFYLQTIFDVLESPEVATKYSRVRKSALTRSQDGSYSIRLTIVFGQ